jgi:hypothetical protein
MLSKEEMKTYFLKANYIALKSEFNHQFHEMTYFKPTFCALCDRLLWGLIRQGWRCKDCGINAHRHCKDRIVIECRPKSIPRNNLNNQQQQQQSSDKPMSNPLTKQSIMSKFKTPRTDIIYDDLFLSDESLPDDYDDQDFLIDQSDEMDAKNYNIESNRGKKTNNNVKSLRRRKNYSNELNTSNNTLNSSSTIVASICDSQENETNDQQHQLQHQHRSYYKVKNKPKRRKSLPSMQAALIPRGEKILDQWLPERHFYYLNHKLQEYTIDPKDHAKPTINNTICDQAQSLALGEDANLHNYNDDIWNSPNDNTNDNIKYTPTPPNTLNNLLISDNFRKKIVKEKSFSNNSSFNNNNNDEIALNNKKDNSIKIESTKQSNDTLK